MSLLFCPGLWQIGKGRVFIESLTVSKELCYSKHKEALLTPLDKAVPAGRQASISKPRVGLIFIRFTP